jgi:hypothetical protein
MPVRPPDPFLDRLAGNIAARKAVAGTGTRQVFTNTRGEEILPDSRGSLHIKGGMRAEQRPALDWGSVIRFTRPGQT